MEVLFEELADSLVDLGPFAGSFARLQGLASIEPW
jgi:hypothetical protein